MEEPVSLAEATPATGLDAHGATDLPGLGLGPDAPEHPGPGLGAPMRPVRPGRLIGEVVVDLGFADREAVEAAVNVARSERKPTGQVLVEQGLLRQDQLARVVAERFGLDYVDLSTHELDMGAVNLLNPDAIKRYQAVPVGFTEDGSILLAMADPTNILTIDDIAMLTGAILAGAARQIAVEAPQLALDV